MTNPALIFSFSLKAITNAALILLPHRVPIMIYLMRPFKVLINQALIGHYHDMTDAALIWNSLLGYD